jgi:Flp pilus assembly protein TadG
MKNTVNSNPSMIHERRRPTRLASPTRVRHDLGQALIELTLMLPIFLLLMIGTVEFGRLAYAYIEVADAARAGVQYGAQNRATSSDNTGMQQAAINDAPEIHGMTAVATHSCLCSTGSGGATCLATACTGGARLVEWVQVNTSAVVDPLFHLPGLPNTFTLKGQAIMRVAQ